MAKLHSLGELLVAGMTLLGATKWPDDHRAFARACDRLPDNEFAKQFLILNGMAGRSSHEFEEIVSLMHAATLISYDSQDWACFNVRVSARISGLLIRRNEASQETMDQVRELLLAHWEEATGQAWGAS